jgi:hypothetical protein
MKKGWLVLVECIAIIAAGKNATGQLVWLQHHCQFCLIGGRSDWQHPY